MILIILFDINRYHTYEINIIYLFFFFFFFFFFFYNYEYLIENNNKN